MHQATNGFLISGNQKILFAGHSLISRSGAPYYETWPFLRLMHEERTWNDDFSEILFCLRPDLHLEFHKLYGTAMRHVLEQYDTLVAPYKPDWVFVGTGATDARMKIPVRDFRATVLEFVRKVRALSNGTTVFLGGLLAENELVKGEWFDPVTLPYYQVLEEVADSEGGIYIDIDTPLATKEEQLKRLSSCHTINGHDGHLNAIGNLIVAWKVLTTLGFVWVD